MAKRFLWLVICLAFYASLAIACRGETTESPRPAEPRAYAGLQLRDTDGLILIDQIDPKGPAASAGLNKQQDLVRGIDGQRVAGREEVYRAIEAKKPGESVTLMLDRYVSSNTAGIQQPPAVQPVVATLQLAEAPTDLDYRWTLTTGVSLEDQTRMGLFLDQVTLALRNHYGLTVPGGVLVRGVLQLPWTPANVAGFQEGDVIVRFNGRKVRNLEDVQLALALSATDKSIAVQINRSGKERRLVLPKLGPDLPSVNHLPADVRERLFDAVDSGNLARQWLDGDGFMRKPHPLSQGQVTSAPTGGQELTGASGAITAISGTSMTIEVASTGQDWTLDVSKGLSVSRGGGVIAVADLRVGEFVEVTSLDGATASNVFSKMLPLPR